MYLRSPRPTLHVYAAQWHTNATHTRSRDRVERRCYPTFHPPFAPLATAMSHTTLPHHHPLSFLPPPPSPLFHRHRLHPAAAAISVLLPPPSPSCCRHPLCPTAAALYTPPPLPALCHRHCPLRPPRCQWGHVTGITAVTWPIADHHYDAPDDARLTHDTHVITHHNGEQSTFQKAHYLWP